MEKRLLGAMLAVAVLILPSVGEAQISGINAAPTQQGQSGVSGPSLPLTDVINLIDQVSSKVVQGGQALQNLASGATGISQTVTAQSANPGGSGYGLSGLTNLWNNVNNWFTQNVGVSLADVVKTVVNFMIYIWTIIIKLLEALVAHL